MRRLALLLAFAGLASTSAAWGVDPVSAYQWRLDAIAAQTAAESRVNYRAALHAAYDRRLLPDFLEAKTVYRTWVVSYFPVLTDYARIDSWVDVERRFERVERDGMTEDAGYLVADHRILIRREENVGRSTLHEAGHALQHDQLALLGRHAMMSDFRLRKFAVTRSDPRLEYLLQQGEFEVRMQDLNRFFAVLHQGRPILSPQDAVVALAMLGADVDSAEVSRALARLGIVWPKEMCLPLLKSSSRGTARTKRAFADAFAVAELLSLSRRKSPELFQTVLGKILLEAPAHL